jgi:very-short-patch-repair endonuclease
MFKRDGEEIALADLYFPQVNVWVEIDESQHLNQTEEDRIRTQEVIKNNIRSKLKNLEEVVYIEL